MLPRLDLPRPAASALPPDAASDPAAAAHIGRLIQTAQLETLYERTLQALPGAALFAALLAWAVAPLAGALMAWGWCVLKQLTLLLRLWDWWQFKRDQRHAEHTRGWHWRHATHVVFDGLGWGLVAPLFMPTGSQLIDGVLVASLIGVASVGVFTVSASFGSAMRFILGTLGPMLIQEFMHPRGNVSWLIAGGCAIYLLVLAVEVWRAQAHTVELLRLRYEKDAAAASRETARRQAEEANAAKSRLLAAVSHELRTPLNGISGMTQLLEADDLPTAQRQRLRVVARAVEHLQTLIEDLLDVSRVELGHLELHPGPCDPSELVDDVAGLLQPLAQARRLSLMAYVEPGVPAGVRLDAPRVRQILHNLVGNALKFTERGSVTVTLRAEGSQLCFVVQDTGPGIDPALHERIFQAFERERSVANRGGAGLGLTISRQLARTMGGDLTVHSLPGEGTRFLLRVAADPCQPPRSSLSPDVNLDALALRGHVLVVEDNEVNAMVTTGMLDQLGLSWRLVGDGEQALRALAEQRFDIVLMDCQMPVLDGLEATRRWRAREAAGPTGQPALPIIALTANAIEGDRGLCLQAGMDSYLSKPFTKDALATVLRRHMTPHRTAMEAAPR
jgi:two-component system, sensor histidine kinase